MNTFLSIIFITGTIYIGIVSGCSGKNIDPKEVKENTSDLKKEPSSDQSSSEKTIERKDQTSLSNPEASPFLIRGNKG